MKDFMDNLTTETPNKSTIDIDEKPPLEIVKLINEEDKKVALAVEMERENIALAIEKITKAFLEGGRLIYIGAGTSGRIGILDASECPPTFGTNKEQVIGIIAGGDKAIVDAVEGAEDSLQGGEEDLKKINLNNNDVVVGIAASGRTPYVVGALEYANRIGAITVSLSCNLNSKIKDIADIAITPIVGPEILTGSTRLKSGTAQKMVLNMLSTGSMIGIGKVYKNLMVDVKPTNKKLLERTKKIIIMATGVSYDEAEAKLIQAKYSAKVAVVMIKRKCSYEEALIRLDKAKGFVNKALLDGELRD